MPLQVLEGHFLLVGLRNVIYEWSPKGAGASHHRAQRRHLAGHNLALEEGRAANEVRICLVFVWHLVQEDFTPYKRGMLCTHDKICVRYLQSKFSGGIRNELKVAWTGLPPSCQDRARLRTRTRCHGGQLKLHCLSLVMYFPSSQPP